VPRSGPSTPPSSSLCVVDILRYFRPSVKLTLPKLYVALFFCNLNSLPLVTNTYIHSLLRQCWQQIITKLRALGRAHVPPTKVFPRLAVNKAILKPRLAAATGAKYLYVDFPDVIKFRVAAYTISVKAIRLRHPDYNPDRVQKLISSSMSRHLSTRNISSKPMHVFLSNLANRQTDRQTNIAGNRIYFLLCWR